MPSIDLLPLAIALLIGIPAFANGCSESIRNLGLDQPCQLLERFLPAEVPLSEPLVAQRAQDRQAFRLNLREWIDGKLP